MSSRLLLAAVLAVSASGCEHGASPSSRTEGPVPAASSAAVETAASHERARCDAERARIAALPALPGAPAFEARRGEILGRAKSEAVVFLRAPELSPPKDLRATVLRDRLAKAAPVISVPSVVETLRYAPEEMRAMFLSEGYVYADSPELATVLVDVLKLGRLFREREIWLARGAETFRLERDDKGSYRYADGDQRGEEASLLFGDRVGTTRASIEPFLHRDLAKLAHDDAPDRLRITRLTEGGALADLRYGETWVPAALDDDGKKLTVACTSIPVEKEAEVVAIREANRARTRSIDRVRDAMRAMVRERLRFDEPLEEVGQQDGSLRPLWRWAYDHGWTSYSFNDVGYSVFDAEGRPSPPQVCVDFVLDAYERASGTWYHREDEPRERTVGTIDFEAADLRNRRSAAELVSFATAHPEWFSVWTPLDEERVPFGHRGEFFASLAEHAGRFHVGDMVVIHGFKPDGKVHYHSFVVDAIDPITGIPHRLAGNAGRPRLQTWEGVMRSAPLRSIRHVITPELAFLRARLPLPSTELATR